MSDDADFDDYGNLQPPRPLPQGWLRRWPAATFLLPLVVYMLLGALESPPPPPATEIQAGETVSDTDDGGRSLDLPIENSLDSLPEEETPGLLPKIPYRYYPAIYTVKMLLVLAAMLAVLPGYRTFPFHVSWLAVAVGVVGVVLWVVLCHLALEAKLMDGVGLGWLIDFGRRSAFNPLEHIKDNRAWAHGFLAIRLFGMAVVVPVIEEFFLRGFVMRFVVNDSFERVPFGFVTPLAAVVGTVVPIMMHPPGELLAALVWFSLLTWLMVRTKNIWDCILAHAVTNLLLGAYVIASGEWQLM